MFGLFETGWLRVKPEIIRLNPTLARPSFYFGQEIRSLRCSDVRSFGHSVDHIGLSSMVFGTFIVTAFVFAIFQKAIENLTLKSEH